MGFGRHEIPLFFLSFENFCFEMISNLKKSCRKNTNILYALPPDSPIVNNYLIVFVIPSLCVCVCVLVCTLFFSEPLESKFRHDAPLLPNTTVYISQE